MIRLCFFVQKLTNQQYKNLEMHESKVETSAPNFSLIRVIYFYLSFSSISFNILLIFIFY